jgi:uncharacterized protein YacL
MNALHEEQPPLFSLFETVTNTAIGFLISLVVWVVVVAPLYDIDLSWYNNLGVTCIFTVISIIRGFVVRRWFETRINDVLWDLSHKIEEWRA